MVVIGYGIAALIVIILLIVFNMRAGGDRSKPEAAPDSEEPGAAVEVPPDEPEDKATDPVLSPERSSSEDQNYRNALRRLNMGQTDRKSAPAAGKKTADEEYREAMRKMRRSKDGKE